MKLFLLLITVLYGVCSAGLGYGRKKLENKNQLINYHLHHENGVKVQTSCDGIEELRFTDAVVDNFAPIESQVKWAGEGQRYWINKENWGGKGYPIFVFIGGEGAEACTRLTSKMYIYELAKEHKALLVDIEHRFYGESYPTEDMSTESLKYLSSTQALADLARLIDHIKIDLNTKESKVITVGGSYPGNLAAWFRLKYPSVTHGSIASSAPVTAKLNFYEYMEVVGKSILYFGSQECYNEIETATKQIKQILSKGLNSEEVIQLSKDYKLCSKMENENDIKIFLSDLMGNIQGTVQYNNEHSGTMNITDVCNVMTKKDDGDAYTKFAKLNDLYLAAYGQECVDASWKDTIEYMQASGKDSTNAARPWTYQTCNEFGYYQTCDSSHQPFYAWKEYLNVDFYRDMCKESFNGWSKDPETEWINEQYGEVHIEGSNILFPSGTIDPWHALGVTNSTKFNSNLNEVPVFILGTAHCNDLYAPNADTDPVSLTQARVVISEHIDKLLH